MMFTFNAIARQSISPARCSYPSVSKEVHSAEHGLRGIEYAWHGLTASDCPR